MEDKQFIWTLFEYTFLRRFKDPMSHFKKFKDYERWIPRYGAVLLSSDLKKIVVVTAYKHKTMNFPKGKVEADESGPECAIWEVQEEIGYDISGNLDTKEYVEIDYQIKERLYIIHGFDETFKFKTETIREIDRIEIKEIEELKQTILKYDNISEDKTRKVKHFLFPILKWINCKKNKLPFPQELKNINIHY